MRSKQRTCATPQGRGNAPINARRNLDMCWQKRDKKEGKSHARLDDGIMRVEKVECPRHGRCPAHGSALSDCWKHDMM